MGHAARGRVNAVRVQTPAAVAVIGGPKGLTTAGSLETLPAVPDNVFSLDPVC